MLLSSLRLDFLSSILLVLQSINALSVEMHHCCRAHMTV